LSLNCYILHDAHFSFKAQQVEFLNDVTKIKDNYELKFIICYTKQFISVNE